MALIIVDLDNTLVNRVQAFRRWAKQFVADNDLHPDLISELEVLDQDGFRTRAEFFELCCHMCTPVTALKIQEHYLSCYPTCFQIEPSTVAKLLNVREAGHAVGIATNGPPFQEAVMEHCGLFDLVDGWVVSEIVGYRKPDIRIAEILSKNIGQPLNGGIVIGDGLADIELAHNLGLPSAWITRDRTWSTELTFRPTIEMTTVDNAIDWVSTQPHAT